MVKTFTKDEQIAALREALLGLLNQPEGQSMRAIHGRRDAQATAHAIYCATAPAWQKDEALKLAQSLRSDITDYAEAIRECGRSILVATSRH